MNLPLQDLYNALYKKLCSVRWLDKIGIPKDFIHKHLKSTFFKTSLENLLKEKNFSCTKILVLCERMLNDLTSAPPENWLTYMYQYSLSKAFPDAVTIELSEALTIPCELYLRILRILSEFQKDSQDSTWQSLYPMHFLTEKEENELESPEEYRKFLKSFKSDYIYEMMKLNGEVFHFNTLDHICGVHYLALYIGRQLKGLGIPIDLGRVSGSAAGHDIGKYGCKGSELKKVPYLHYYYSDQWFSKHDIRYIGNIALNHSVWDLELESLSLESLILIYADFRVKNMDTPQGVQMHIFNLKASFDVILEKLDNLDDKKLKRYQKAYSKLKDFEDFLLDIGVITEITAQPPLAKPKNKISYPLMHGEVLIENLKYLAIQHNVNLMYQLRDEYALDMILQFARSEQNWKHLREYIRIFEEYSTYLTQKQKLQTIRFLYENLIHPEDDIRRHCAALIGSLIAIFDEDYRKEIPNDVKLDSPEISSLDLFKQYLALIISPSHKIIATHRFWMGYNVRIMVNSVFSRCRKSLISEYRDILITYYSSDKNYKNIDTQIFLLETIKYIPFSLETENLNIIFEFLFNMLSKRNSTLRFSALETSYRIVPKMNSNSNFILKLKNYVMDLPLKSSTPVENNLLLKLIKALQLEKLIPIFDAFCKLDDKKIPEIFLSNLKTATDWVRKKNQIDLLLDYTLKNPSNKLHSAIHFCNLLKVSAVETVRNKAGMAVLKLMPILTLAERNEVAIELLRAIEIEGHRFTEYIPYYLGQIILWLPPKELNEIIDDFILKIKYAYPHIKSLILKTTGLSLAYFPNYEERFDERQSVYHEVQVKMLGVLFNGLADYNLSVKIAALSVFGKEIFGSQSLTLEQKERIFTLSSKKILTLITDTRNEELLFLTNSASLNHIYRFISDYTFFNGKINVTTPSKIAFFPGTYDPFSLSHKEIAKSIRNLGFEVYLAVDEFSWSKQTLPNLLRRNILSMSIADELDIYIYPDKYPTNIANPKDLKDLKENFSNSSVFIAVGGDVVLNASSYKNQSTENSIHTFNHIIFERGKPKKLMEATKRINGEVLWLALPPKYMDISSTQIRNNIDENRDISSLVDPLAQQYIYENGFYQRAPLEKSLIKSLWLKIDIVEELSQSLIKEVCKFANSFDGSLESYLIELAKKPSGRLVILRDSITNAILAFSSFHWVRSSVLYTELKDEKLSQYIRENSLGRIILIECLVTNASDTNKAIEQILLTETISLCVSRDYGYAIFKNLPSLQASSSMCELLRLHGFVNLSKNVDEPIYVVDMNTPCVLHLDMRNILKEPFRSNLKIKQVISNSRKKLQHALTELYPGKLVLSIDSNILHQSMIRKICKENEVCTETTVPTKLGTAMCVPYGDILDRYVIPNTVTKALHTEKLFNPDMKSFKISAFPHYLSLENQVKMLKSFNRSIILVDNLLHKGYRMQALDPLIKNENLTVKKIIVGILSGQGKELMDIQNREVDCVYFIPRLKIWFNENALYPFIGGDALWRDVYPERNLLPSINLIMPYTSPTFIKGASTASIFNLSKTCIENSIEILSTIEQQYHLIHQRNLTVSSLGEVLTIPRCPEHGKNMEYDLSLNPTLYLKNDLELLNRLEHIIHGL